ncbi:ATP-dependent Clp protease ATP-binding subunit ClpX [compost metagenome]
MGIHLKKVVVCDFCGKDQHSVAHMFAGPPPATPAICDECIDLCAEILAEQRAKQEAA